MLTAIRRALRVGRDEGLRSLAVRSLAATCYARLVLLERRLDDPADPLPELVGALELEFGRLTGADAEEYAALVPWSGVEEVPRRLRAGELGFSIRHRGRLVGVSWAVFGVRRISHLHGSLALAPDEALIEAAYVAPELRGKGVAAEGGRDRLSCLREAGYRRAIALVLPENTAGFGPPVRLGYRRAGMLVSIGLGERRRVIAPRRRRTRETTARA